MAWREVLDPALGMWKYISLCRSDLAQNPSPMCCPALLKCLA
eukprot:CAMPEP_0114252128 /NCGR_PEP_ID=MMETSP0058-20121206/15665_1 /TAXON_ID=36894 /ORGANISM="Pyramimonas parkeae, CCMP726" /LENGTH=41 /DNA_ID= /DNA_START= /DNA_END= /DNA_ORIENTATION=